MSLQDIIGDDEIKLDWFFKMSMIHDLANVSVCLLVSTDIFFAVQFLLRFTTNVLSLYVDQCIV